MKKFEIIVGIIAICGIIIKFIFMRSELMTLAFLMLAILYFYFSFAFFNGIRLRDIFKKASYKDTNAKRIIGAIGLGFFISLLIMGILFKLQFWPFAITKLFTGLVGTGIIFSIALIFYSRNNSKYYKRVFTRIFIYGSLGLVFYLIPTATIFDIYYRNVPEHAKKLLADPYNIELQKEFEETERKIRQQKENDK